MSRDPNQPKSRRKRRVPAWERPTPTLLDLSQMRAFDVLTTPAKSEHLGEAVDAWESFDPGVRSFVMARVGVAQVILLDRLVRRTERLIALTDSVRTGTRLTVEELRKAPQAPPPGYEDFGADDDYEDDDFGPEEYAAEEYDDPQPGDVVGDVVVLDNSAGEVDPDLAAQFAALDASPSGSVVNKPAAEEPAPKKRRSRKKSSASNNGAPPPAVDVLDANGNPVSGAPPAQA